MQLHPPSGEYLLDLTKRQVAGVNGEGDARIVLEFSRQDRPRPREPPKGTVLPQVSDGPHGGTVPAQAGQPCRERAS